MKYFKDCLPQTNFFFFRSEGENIKHYAVDDASVNYNFKMNLLCSRFRHQKLCMFAHEHALEFDRMFFRPDLFILFSSVETLNRMKYAGVMTRVKLRDNYAMVDKLNIKVK